jgi:hypothetical protein
VLAVVAAIVLQVLLPDQMSLGSRWILPGLEALILLATNPFRIDRESAVLHVLGIGLVVALTAATAVSTASPVVGIISVRFGDDAGRHGRLDLADERHRVRVACTGSSTAGRPPGPGGHREHPDFLFPQMQLPDRRPGCSGPRATAWCRRRSRCPCLGSPHPG